MTRYTIKNLTKLTGFAAHELRTMIKEKRFPPPDHKVQLRGVAKRDEWNKSTFDNWLWGRKK